MKSTTAEPSSSPPRLAYPAAPDAAASRNSLITANDRISAFPSMRADQAPSPTIGTGDAAPAGPGGPHSGLIDDEDYELLQESGVLPSEDEAETVSSFTLEGPMADDVRSVITDSNDSEESIDDEDLTASEPVEPLFEPSESGMTARPPIESIHSSLSSDRLASSATMSNWHLDFGLSYELVFQTLDRMHLDKWAEAANETWTLQYALSKETLKWTGPFHILFCGIFPDESKDIIISTIARALQHGQSTSEGAESGPSHLSVVPISAFGGGEAQDVELIPTAGFNIVHDHCKFVGLAEAKPGNKNRLLIDTYSTWDNVEDEDDPRTRKIDLAIMGGPSNNIILRAMDQNEMQSTRSLGSRDIPILRVAMPCSDSPAKIMVHPWNNLHMRVEVRDAQGHTQDEHRPVPLNIFSSLEPRVLNKHIACLRAACDRGPLLEPRRAKFGFWKTMYFRWKYSRLDRFDCIRIFRKLVLWLLLTVTFMSLIKQLVSMQLNSAADATARQAKLSSDIAKFVNASKPVTTKDPSLMPWKGLGSSSGFPEETVPQINIPKTTDKSIGAPNVDHLSPKSNDSDEFKVHIVGDHHFILTPPKKWKPSKLNVEVLRGSGRSAKVVHSEGEQLDGVFAVKLDRKEAHGILNVNVWVVHKSKAAEPQLLQNVTVDFGSPWYTLDGLNSLTNTALTKARTDLMVFQSDVVNKSMQLYTGLQRAGGNAQASSHQALQQTLQLVNKTVATAHMRADGLLQAWKGATSLQKHVPQTPVVYKAHKNALAIADKMRAKFDGLRKDKTEVLVAECKKNRGRGLACGKLNGKALEEFHAEKKRGKAKGKEA